MSNNKGILYSYSAHPKKLLQKVNNKLEKNKNYANDLEIELKKYVPDDVINDLKKKHQPDYSIEDFKFRKFGRSFNDEFYSRISKELDETLCIDRPNIDEFIIMEVEDCVKSETILKRILKENAEYASSTFEKKELYFITDERMREIFDTQDGTYVPKEQIQEKLKDYRLKKLENDIKEGKLNNYIIIPNQSNLEKLRSDDVKKERVQKIKGLFITDLIKQNGSRQKININIEVRQNPKKDNNFQEIGLYKIADFKHDYKQYLFDIIETNEIQSETNLEPDLEPEPEPELESESKPDTLTQELSNLNLSF